MSFLTTLFSFIAALPKLIDQLREMYWQWETARGLRRERELVSENDKIHDEMANGGRPKWDDRN